jgi:hypothetical protein
VGIFLRTCWRIEGNKAILKLLLFWSRVFDVAFSTPGHIYTYICVYIQYTVYTVFHEPVFSLTTERYVR